MAFEILHLLFLITAAADRRPSSVAIFQMPDDRSRLLLNAGPTRPYAALSAVSPQDTFPVL